jgi:hypothetical protein
VRTGAPRANEVKLKQRKGFVWQNSLVKEGTDLDELLWQAMPPANFFDLPLASLATTYSPAS